MSAWSILLRMLLCLGLILNGSGYALASASMPMEHSLASASAADVVTPAARTAAKDVPCHQQKHGTSESAAAAARSPSSASLPGSQSPNDEPPTETPDLACDCCESGLCRGTCMHQGQAAVPAASQYDAVPAHDCDARPARPGHAAPALSHLIRPPIA
ncbi:CopL family metal-binding regulatory protein [Luteimonas suaedae]|uniref:CopL family metal-binding regulatory protein n=1 Tax=Luteimonas suaedae TaxID=2605430 RepID=UPI0011F00DC9|nr:CopL family metal-binding regulatory protein [Luteimonas suaedae]